MDFFDKIITNDLYRGTVILIIVLLIICFSLFCLFAHIICKAKIFSKFRLVKSIALVSPIIASVVAVLCILFITIGNYISNNKQSSSDLNPIIGEINIVTTILSIAIAVWIGLNIYNIVEKRQIDQLSIRTKAIKRSTEKSKKTSKEISSTLENLKSQVENDADQLEKTQIERIRSSVNLLINILINTQQDNMTGYFIRRFYSILDSKDELKKTSELDISKLICIETYFNNVYQSYKTNDRSSVYFFAFKGIETIQENEKNCNENQGKLNLYSDYLIFRKAEFHFYLGMVQYGKTSVEFLDKAINFYLEFTESIKMILPNFDICEINMEDIDGLENINLDLPDDIKQNKEKAYLCNTLGQAYNRMIRQELKECISNIDEKYKPTILNHYKRAFVYFKSAVLCEGDSKNYREQYVRNLGTFYELLRLLIKDFDPYSRVSVKENKEKLIKILDKANSYYSEGLYLDGRKTKAHITDAAARLKKIFVLSEIEDRKYINGHAVNRIEPLFNRMMKHDFDFGVNNDEYQRIVKNAIVKYELSLSLTPRILDSYYGLAKAYLWLALNEKDILKSLDYLNQGEKYIVQGRMINNDNIPLELFFIDYNELKSSLREIVQLKKI